MAAAELLDSHGDSLEPALRLLVECVHWLHANYVDTLPPHVLVGQALDGILGHADPYTELLTAGEWERVIEGTTSGYVGIGVGLDFAGSVPLIRSVHPGSPAAAVGLLPGDRMLRAAGESLSDLEPHEVSVRIRGPEGSSLRLEVVDPQGEVRREVEVARAHLDLPAVEAARIAGGAVGYVRLLRFGFGTTARMRAQLEAWAPDPPAALIVDLRGNPGGLFDDATELADLFLPAGAEIVRTTSRLVRECEEIYATDASLPAPADLLLLTDSLTASSAEVFAGALQGAGRALLAGELTYGKRSIQRFRPLRGGGALKLTTSRFRTPGDREELARGARPVAAGAAGLLFHGEEDRRERTPLQPDIPLPAVAGDAFLSRCDSAGLIARFLHLRTLPEGDGAAPSAWSADGPPACWNDFARQAGGFPRWREQFHAAMERWGIPAAHAVGGGERPASGPEREAHLQRLWVADWAGECWGPETAAAAKAELDPWVQASLRILDGPQAALTCRETSE
ncbi:MAG: hypothetical protein KAY32_09085 [Candidatus Eisenbacteria sp.]|nr:hypothetical protein [Candidatus Eisenbacteria bacterium]